MVLTLERGQKPKPASNAGIRTRVYIHARVISVASDRDKRIEMQSPAEGEEGREREEAS